MAADGVIVIGAGPVGLVVAYDYGYRVHATGEMVTYNLDGLVGETWFPYNVHLGQDELYALVLERLQALPDMSVRWGTRVTGMSQASAEEIVIDAVSDVGEEQLRGAWAIGCDGARSTVRRLLGLQFQRMTWDTRERLTFPAKLRTAPPV